MKNVAGTITINNAANLTQQNHAAATSQNTKFSVDIPAVSGNGFVQSYGKYYLLKDDNVYADVAWKGNGHVMLLYTKENLSTDDIAALVDKGILPLGGGGKFLGSRTEVTSKFTYQSPKKGVGYNFTTSADEICKTMSVPSEGDYYFYIVAKSDTEITDVKGDIIFGEKLNSTFKTGEKLPHMSVWIGSAGEIKTSTGIKLNARNYTGDKSNYDFSSEENGSKTLKLNSSLTGEYEIVFVTSDRTIIKTIPAFTGNKEITLTELPKDTISMKVYAINVSGFLTIDSN